MKARDIVINSMNQVKILAVKAACRQVYGECTEFWNYIPRTSRNCDTLYGQPLSMDQTIRGAEMRATSAFKFSGEWSFGLEGGLFFAEGTWICTGIVAVTKDGIKTWIGQCPGVMVPREIIRIMLAENVELGVAEDRFFSTSDLKCSSGLTGTISRGHVMRQDAFRIGTLCALGAMECEL